MISGFLSEIARCSEPVSDVKQDGTAADHEFPVSEAITGEIGKQVADKTQAIRLSTRRTEVWASFLFPHDKVDVTRCNLKWGGSGGSPSGRRVNKASEDERGGVHASHDHPRKGPDAGPSLVGSILVRPKTGGPTPRLHPRSSEEASP